MFSRLATCAPWPSKPQGPKLAYLSLPFIKIAHNLFNWRKWCYEYDSSSTGWWSFPTFNTYMHNPFINCILIDRYFKYEFSETWFRAICLEMSLPFREHYATLPKLPFASNRPQNHLLTNFFYMNWCRFYISIYWF